MNKFDGRLAVITGAGTGMGRELARQLAAAGCDLALCDLTEGQLESTVAACRQARGGVKVSSHACDVSDESAVVAFRDAVARQHATDAVHLLFNNAGIGGGGSFVNGDRDEWERTFGVCWFGVYYCTRAFLPLLIAADAAHIVNTSSINGFWASLGPDVSHTAYSTAKFAVKGFSEALLTDLRLNAPHVGVSVVMPGHVGTDIVINTGRALGIPEPEDMNAEQVAEVRALMVDRGLPVDNVPDDQIRGLLRQRAEAFRERAPTSASDAATVILDGVREKRWRILVGADAFAVDAAVRADPEQAYEPSFTEALRAQGHFHGLMRAPQKDESREPAP